MFRGRTTIIDNIGVNKMPLLIDGYNLLHISGILGRGRGPGGLEQSRTALLNFLAASLDPSELRHTTVIFDSNDAPRGLPKSLEHQGISVRFAAQYESADELICELIRADFAPRRLTVVSSDHEIQRAARRRRAKAVDSDVWFAELIRLRRERGPAETESSVRPAVPLLEEDVEYWFRQFGGEQAFADLFSRERVRKANKPSTPASPTQASAEECDPAASQRPPKLKGRYKAHQQNREVGDDKPHALDDIFPPGYGDDLIDEM